MNVLHVDVLSRPSQTLHVLSLVRGQQIQGICARPVMINHLNKQRLFHDQIQSIGGLIQENSDADAILCGISDLKIDLIHVHSPLLLSLTVTLSHRLNTPFVITCHGLGFNRQEFNSYLEASAAIICTSTRVAHSISQFAAKTHIIPYGVNVKDIIPGLKTDPMKIAFVARVNQSNENAFRHFCKAVDLLESVEFYVISNKAPASNTGIFLGSSFNTAELLAKTDIVVGTGRAIREGLATGNAVLIMGRTFGGLITPEKVARQSYLDTSGLSGSDPCYKTIFYDLAKLTQNEIYLRQLQKFGRELAEKEFNQIKLTKKIIDIYHHTLNYAYSKQRS